MIEYAAVKQAIAHYEGLGYVAQDVGLTHSYDLLVVRGDEVRHIEVKGSQAHLEKKQLTCNEVNQANDFQSTDLVIVDEIQWGRLPDGSFEAFGGQLQVVPNWRPSPENLKPMTFEYFLD